jgi:hypothetical protein
MIRFGGPVFKSADDPRELARAHKEKGYTAAYVPHVLLDDKENFIGRNLSTSYAPKEETEPAKYHGLVRELGEFFDEYSSNGVLIYPHFSMCFTGRV